MFKRRIRRLYAALVDVIATIRWATEQRKKWHLPEEDTMNEVKR